tara:strand:- start:1226 stop:1606 length:381 start_codon:yes stop_codon:yes gene_type:complete
MTNQQITMTASVKQRIPFFHGAGKISPTMEREIGAAMLKHEKKDGHRQAFPNMAPRTKERALGPEFAQAIIDFMATGKKTFTEINRGLGSNKAKTHRQLAAMINDGSIKHVDIKRPKCRLVKGYTL